TRLRDRLACRDHGELRHAVEQADLARVEVIGGNEALHLGDDLGVDPLGGEHRGGAEAALPRRERRPIGGRGEADRRNRAQSGNDDAAHADAVFSATSPSTARTSSPTVLKSNSVLALNGISMLNLSS